MIYAYNEMYVEGAMIRMGDMLEYACLDCGYDPVRGMTQQELAECAHMSTSQLQRLEYGERKVENLSLKSTLALAKALGVAVEELE